MSLTIVALAAPACGRPLVDSPRLEGGPPPSGCLAQVAGVYDSVFVARRRDGTIWAAPAHDRYVELPGPTGGHFAARDLAVAGSTAYGTAVGCAIVAGGAVWCFPVAGPLVHSGDLGAGLGPDVTTTAAVQVVTSAQLRAPLLGARKVVASMNGAGATFCALTDAGNVLCWGTGGSGLLGHGDDDAAPFARPVLVDPTTPLQNVADVSLGYDSACAVLHDRSVSCWGDNRLGQLGGASTLAESPFAVRLTLPPVDRLANEPGTTHCARLSDDRVACWGWNAYSQAGAADAFTAVGPTIVLESPGGAPLRGVQELAPDHGMQAMCGTTLAGRLVCWGNPFPAPGLPAVESPFPVELPGAGPQAGTSLAAFGGRDGALLWIDPGGHLAVGAGAAPLSVQPPCGSM
jgi:hypothetical protein